MKGWGEGWGWGWGGVGVGWGTNTAKLFAGCEKKIPRRVKQWSISGLSFSLFSSFQCSMTGFELRISGVGSDRIYQLRHNHCPNVLKSLPLSNSLQEDKLVLGT